MDDHYTISPVVFLKKIKSMRKDYEKRTGTVLAPKPVPGFLDHCANYAGYKALFTRNNQVTSLESWTLRLEKYFQDGSKAKDLFKSLRILMSYCLFIDSELSSGSVLRRLIKEAMQISSSNRLDNATRAACFLSAKNFLETKEHPYSPKFQKFINQKCQDLDFSLADITVPLFSIPMEWAGIAAGYVIGETCSQSIRIVTSHSLLSVSLGSGLFWMMGASPGAGLLLIAPFANRLIDTFYGVSSAYVLGFVMRTIGTITGHGAALSLEMGWRLLCYTFRLIQQINSEQQPAEEETFSLIDNQPSGAALLNLQNHIKRLYINIEELPGEEGDLDIIPCLANEATATYRF